MSLCDDWLGVQLGVGSALWWLVGLHTNSLSWISCQMGGHDQTRQHVRYVLSPASVGEPTHLDFRATGLDSGNNLENLHCNIRMLYCALCIHDYQYNDSFWDMILIGQSRLISYVNCEPGPQKQSCSRVYLQPIHCMVKIIEFSFMSKIIRILIKDNVPWRYLVNVLP